MDVKHYVTHNMRMLHYCDNSQPTILTSILHLREVNKEYLFLNFMRNTDVFVIMCDVDSTVFRTQGSYKHALLLRVTYCTSYIRIFWYNKRPLSTAPLTKLFEGELRMFNDEYIILNTGQRNVCHAACTEQHC